MPQYDDVAEHYERLVAPKYLPIARVVAERIPTLTDRSVLEVGAGTGLLTRLLTPDAGFRSYVASDVSGPMLAMAAALVGDDVTYVEADVRDLPLASGTVDLVIGCLTPLQDVDEGFREARRVLRPAGEVIVGFWGDVYAELELLDEVRHRMDLGAYARDREGSAIALATAAGFPAPTVEVVRLAVHHTSVEAYLDYRASFGHLSFVPEDRRDAWVDTLREVSAEWAGPDGSIDLDWAIAVLRAAVD